MTDQTPSTEDVRYDYRTGVTAPLLPVEAGDAFDAWLAARDREVAAKALREAAEGFRFCEDYRYRATRAMATENYLRARADRLENIVGLIYDALGDARIAMNRAGLEQAYRDITDEQIRAYIDSEPTR